MTHNFNLICLFKILFNTGIIVTFLVFAGMLGGFCVPSPGEVGVESDDAESLDLSESESIDVMSSHDSPSMYLSFPLCLKDFSYILRALMTAFGFSVCSAWLHKDVRVHIEKKSVLNSSEI